MKDKIQKMLEEQTALAQQCASQEEAMRNRKVFHSGCAEALRVVILELDKPAEAPAETADPPIEQPTQEVTSADSNV